MTISLEELTLKEENEERIILVCKALSSNTRYKIVKLLSQQEYDISRLAEELDQTEANISAQVKQLERAGLLESRYEPGSHGVLKICSTVVSKITIDIINSNN